MFGDEVESIAEFDPLTGKKTQDLQTVRVYAASHYVAPRRTLKQAIDTIKEDLKGPPGLVQRNGRFLEAQRLEQRTTFDIEMMEATGSCAGIENYSRYLTGRRPGEPPPTFFEYLPADALLFADESHVTIPQIGAMYKGDSQPQDHARRVRLPPPLRHGQPPPQVRGVGGHAPPDGARQRHPRPLGDRARRRRLRRAGDPPHRPDRPPGRGSPRHRPTRQPGRRRHRRGPRRWRPRASAP
jgi:hypothetical protein